MRLLRRRPTASAPAIEHRAAVGGHWDEVGRAQLDFLLANGLQPSDRFLDVACGSFRLGRLLIPYLEPGRYTGVEADAELLETGRREELGAESLVRKPVLLNLRMPAPLPEADVAWAHALFDHIEPEDTRATLREMVAAAPRVFVTFFIAERPEEPKHWLRNGSEDGAITTYPDREYWHHGTEWIEAAARDAGARVAAWHRDYPHPLGLTIVELARAA